MRLNKADRQCTDLYDAGAVPVDDFTFWDVRLGGDSADRDGVDADSVLGESPDRSRPEGRNETLPGFSLAGLSDPDSARRESEWLKFFATYFEPLMKVLAREEPDYDRPSDLAQLAFVRAHAAIVISNWPLKSADKAQCARPPVCWGR